MAPNKPITVTGSSGSTLPDGSTETMVNHQNNSSSPSSLALNKKIIVMDNSSKNVSNTKSSSSSTSSPSLKTSASALLPAAAVAALSRESNMVTTTGNQTNNTRSKKSGRTTNRSSTTANNSNNRNSMSPPPMAPDRSIPEVREYLFKILVIGELGTGKTSFIKRYVHQYFSQYYRATIGVDFALKVLNWDDTTLVRLQLWDIAGQERFGNMTRIYYKEAVGAFLVFDVSAPSSFNAVLKWKHDLDTKVCMADGEPIPCLLLANKCDATKEGIAADTELMDKFSKENNFCGWFYTSAKENINIEESAKFLVGKILQRQKHLAMEDDDDGNDVINLAYGSHRTSKSNKCNC